MNAHPALNQLVQGSAWHSHFLREISHRQPSPVPLHIGALVRSLLFDRGPSAIFLTVPYERVDTVERHPFRALPHVRKEPLERAYPFVAKGNSSPSVCRILRVLRVGAPLFCGLPTAIGRAAGKAMRSAQRTGLLLLQASATIRFARCQFMPGGDLFSTAVASANPLCSCSIAGRSSGRTSNHHEPSISVSGSVNQSSHEAPNG